MPRLVVVSHNLKSNALKNLAEELSNQLGYKVWRKKPEQVRHSQQAVTFLPGINKIQQFVSFHRAGVSCPRYATNLEDAQALDCKEIVARLLIDSSEGKGIQICKKGDPLPNAPLYTEYIPKKKEFRVHVWNNEVIDTQEKRRRRGNEDQEFQVRNTANGYVFCRDNVNPPTDCHPVALGAVAALGRSYGAVDIIWNEKRNTSYVLEVNSRPGMEGTTVKKYADAIVADNRDALAKQLPRADAERRPAVLRHARVHRADGKKLITTRKGNKVWR